MSSMRVLRDTIKRHMLTLALAYIMLAGRAVTEVLPAYYLGEMIDLLTASTSAIRPLVLLVLCAVASSTLSFLGPMLQTRVGLSIGHELRLLCQESIAEADTRELDKVAPGDALSAVNVDSRALESVLTETIPGFVWACLSVGATVVLLYCLSPLLTLASCLLIPLFFVPARATSHLTRAAWETTQEAGSALTSFLGHILGAAKTIKLYGLQTAQKLSFSALSMELNDRTLRAVRLSQVLGSASSLLSVAAPLLVLLYGLRMVATGHTSIGTLVAFATATSRLFSPVSSLSGTQTRLVRVKVHIERLERIIQLPREGHASRKSAAPRSSPIRFDGVWFSYDASRPVLKDFCLTVPGGGFVTLVGESGCGKTTVVQLLAGLYLPDRGSIELGRQRLGSDDRDLIRNAASFCTQPVDILVGSLDWNITLAGPGEPGDVDEALEWACLRREDIPPTFGRGTELSAGQRKRVGLARAMFRSRPYLVLDEPTEGLDPETCRLVIDNIVRLARGRTCIVTTHHVELARHADLVAFLQDGRVAELGPHESLLSCNSDYTRFAEHWIVREEEEGIANGFGRRTQ